MPACPRSEPATRQGRRHLRCVLPGEHHLEHRHVHRLRRGCSDLHDLLEGKVLVLLRRQHLRPCRSQELRGRGLRPDPHSHGQRVDEEANQRLRLRTQTTRHRAPDHHLLLARHPAQQRGPTREQGHVERAPVTATQSPQTSAQVRPQHHLHAVAHILLLRRTCVIPWQLQLRWRPRQRLLPVRRLGAAAPRHRAARVATPRSLRTGSTAAATGPLPPCDTPRREPPAPRPGSPPTIRPKRCGAS